MVVVRVDGDIDMSAAHDMYRGLAARLTNEGAGLVLDLTATSYLDSAGIELVFDLARRLRTRRQSLGLVVPREAPMRRVLAMYDVEAVAPIDTSVEAAVGGVRDQAARSSGG